MTSPALHDQPLTISLVLYHSDLGRLAVTLDSLAVALAGAREAGYRGRAEVRLLDQSEDPAYHASLRHLLAAREGAVPEPAGQLLLAPLMSAENRGYGAGHNRLLKDVREGLCLVLNPDLELAADAVAHGLRTFSERPRAVLLCPRGEDGRGRPAHLGKDYPSVLVLGLRAGAPRWLQRRFRRQLAAYARHDLEHALEPTPLVLGSGCFMLLRAEAFAAVDGFDEGYFLYFEDYDLSLRLAREGEVLYVPGMRVRHHGGDSAGKGWSHRARFLRSAWRFFRSHGWRGWA